MGKNKYGLIIWLSFFFPQIALFLYLMEEDKNTNKAKALLSGLKLFIGLFILSLIVFAIIIILPIVLNMLS